MCIALVYVCFVYFAVLVGRLEEDPAAKKPKIDFAAMNMAAASMMPIMPGVAPMMMGSMMPGMVPPPMVMPGMPAAQPLYVCLFICLFEIAVCLSVCAFSVWFKRYFTCCCSCSPLPLVHKFLVPLV